MKIILLKIKRIFKFATKVLNYVNGETAYQKFLEFDKKNRCANINHNHPQQTQSPSISKKEFLNQKRNQKWQKINRCC